MLPIIYCDTSFILEYWEAGSWDDYYGIEFPISEEEKAFKDFVKSIVRSELKKEKLKPFKKLIMDREIEIDLISSAFSLLEIFEKHAEWNIKSIISDSTNIDRVFNIGKKQTGDYIEKIYNSGTDISKKIFGSLFPPELDDVLDGIEFKNIQNLDLNVNDIYSKFGIFSLLQVGPIDILHLIAANHLNAKYFLTFDSDYKRIRKVVESNMGIELILNAQELSSFIRKNFNQNI